MDDGVSWLSGILMFLLFILLDGIFYGFGAAIQSLNESDVEKKAEEGSRKARILLEYIQRPRTLDSATLVVVTFSGAAAGAYGVWRCGRRLAEGMGALGWVPVDAGVLEWVAGILILFATTALLLIFGILAPKRVAAKHAAGWAYGLVGPVRLVGRIFGPLTYIILLVSHLIIRIFGIDPHDETEDVTEEEIISMVNEGHEQGVLMAGEAEMIHNIIEFGDKVARDIITHRKNIIALDADMALEDAQRFIIQQNKSRFPVYEHDIDNIIGILHLRDAFEFCQIPQYRKQSLKTIPDLLREVAFIPETRSLLPLFKEMQSQKNHMVMVVDEYGQISGLIAMEDILEEIVGNIMDEYDEEDPNIQQLREGAWLVKGLIPLEELSDELSIDFGTEDYETLNGFLISLIDKIPEEGEEIKIERQGYRFEVLSVENKMIQEVRVEKLEPPQPEEE